MWPAKPSDRNLDNTCALFTILLEARQINYPATHQRVAIWSCPRREPRYSKLKLTRASLVVLSGRTLRKLAMVSSRMNSGRSRWSPNQAQSTFQRVGIWNWRTSRPLNHIFLQPRAYQTKWTISQWSKSTMVSTSRSTLATSTSTITSSRWWRRLHIQLVKRGTTHQMK